MRTRTMVAATAVAASLVGGAAAGALLFTPGLSGAQTRTVVASAATAGAGAHEGDGRPDPGAGLDAAASAIGISAEDLRSALDGGKTIAQVAADHGVEVQKVIDAMVAEAQARLDAARAALPERIAAVVNGTAPRPGPGRPGGGPEGPRRAGGPGLGAAATALGMTDAELRAALRDGSSLAAVATSRSIDPQKVIDAIVAAESSRIDQAVADGKLDASAGAAHKAQLRERITAFVHGQRPAGGPREGRGAAYTD
jgi:hypothetical protein